MKLRSVVALGSLLILGMPVLVLSVAKSPNESTSDAIVTLHDGLDLSPSGDQSGALYSKALEILRSSQFNSAAPNWERTVADAQSNYRKTISGRYLLFVLKEPRGIQTMGGEVDLWEIVVGLNAPGYASSLFTIDEDGRIVEHAKYLGPLCIEIMQMTEEMLAAASGSSS